MGQAQSPRRELDAGQSERPCVIGPAGAEPERAALSASFIARSPASPICPCSSRPGVRSEL